MSSTCDIVPWSVSIERLTSSAESTTVDVAGSSDIFDALSSPNFSVCDKSAIEPLKITQTTVRSKHDNNPANWTSIQTTESLNRISTG